MAEAMKQAWEQLNQEWVTFKEIHQRAIDEAKARWGTADILLSDHKTQLERVQDQLDKLELRLNRPVLGGDGRVRLPGEKTPEEKAFTTWQRRGEKGLTPDEWKLLSVGDDTEGGYLVPAVRAEGIVQKLVEFSPVRELATVVSISTGDAWEMPREGATNWAADWVSETGSRTQTTAQSWALERVQVHEMYANPFITQRMLEDTSFDLDSWIDDGLSRRFGVVEGTAFIGGNGVGKPEGLLTPSSITTVNTGSAADITADGMITTFYTLPEFYAANATWLMRRATIRVVRQLKDGNGQYLWQLGLAGGAPATILDRPYREAMDMPAIAANANVAIFGDIRRAYAIVDRRQMMQVRDPFTSKPNVELYTTKRVGGQPVLVEAYVVMKVAA